MRDCEHEWHLVITFIKGRGFGCEYRATLVPSYAFYCPLCKELMWSTLNKKMQALPERWAWNYRTEEDGTWNLVPVTNVTQ